METVKTEFYKMTGDEFAIADKMFFTPDGGRMSEPYDITNSDYDGFELAGWMSAFHPKEQFGHFVNTILSDSSANKFAIIKENDTLTVRALPGDFSAKWFATNNRAFYFTFGDAEYFPYGPNDFVVVYASGVNAARELFSRRYPLSPSNLLNCAFVYDEREWHEHVERYYERFGSRPIPAAELFATPGGGMNFYETIRPKYFIRPDVKETKER